MIDIKSKELDNIIVKGKKELVTIYKPVQNLMEGYDFNSTTQVKTTSKKDIKNNQKMLNKIAGIEVGEVITWNP